MRIAYISYEYPLDTGVGGIATYNKQVAAMMRSLGHSVEMFCGSPTKSQTVDDAGVLVHQVQVARREDFGDAIVASFSERHRAEPFDLIEAAEFGADGDASSRKHPEVTYVVRLHTPTYLASLAGAALTPIRKLKLLISPINPRGDKTRLKSFLAERRTTRRADLITSPSSSLADITAVDWGIARERITVIPNPYEPSPALLQLELPKSVRTVTFLGRVEVRKGVLELARAAKLIEEQLPGLQYRFVGRDGPSPTPGLSMSEAIRSEMGDASAHAIFDGHVGQSELPKILSESDVCVFPSRWENFPYVCLEAMAAGRAVVGSEAGGMLDMLDGGACGRLVPPGDPQAIATAILGLAREEGNVSRLGQAARIRVLDRYRPSVLAVETEQLYAEAIRNHTAKSASKGKA